MIYIDFNVDQLSKYMSKFSRGSSYRMTFHGSGLTMYPLSNIDDKNYVYFECPMVKCLCASPVHVQACRCMYLVRAYKSLFVAI